MMNIGDTLFHDGKTYIIDSVKENDNKDWIVFGANVSKRNPDEKPLTIEVGKFYKTRDGQKVRIYATDGHFRSIHGAIMSVFGDWNHDSWLASGRHNECDERRIDIISEWPDEKPVPDIRWDRIPEYAQSVYVGGGLRGLMYDDNMIYERSEADDWAFHNWRDFIGQTFERPKA